MFSNKLQLRMTFEVSLSSRAPQSVAGMKIWTLVSHWPSLLSSVVLTDQGYCVRTNAQEYEFFKQGRVFAMLWSETAGHSLSKRTPTENSNFTAHPNSSLVQGQFGERIYSSIRRFVIVRVNRQSHFVEAW
jgi:hypothetical protein